MKAKLLIILAVLLLSGCSSIAIKDSSVKKREFSVSILGGVLAIESTTEDLVIGSLDAKKEEEDEE